MPSFQKASGEPYTSRQTFGIFKLTQKDYRTILARSDADYNDVSYMMQAAHEIRKSGGSINEARMVIDKALEEL